MPGAELAPLTSRAHEYGGRESLLTDVWSMLGRVDEGEGEGQVHFEPPFIEAFCSHCESRATHELVAIGEIRASEYRCGSCRGRTCRCANFDHCGGAARVELLWDEAMCHQCSSAVERTIEGIVPDLKPQADATEAWPPALAKSEPEPDGWAVLAHLMLPPGLDGGVRLKKRPDKVDIAAHVPANAPGSPSTRRSQSESPLRQRCPSPRRTEHAANTHMLMSALPPLPRRNASTTDLDEYTDAQNESENAGQLCGQRAGLGSQEPSTPPSCASPTPDNSEALVETAKALKAAMQVAHPVMSLPAEVVEGASTTELETWEYMREALLSWPGPERENIDKYRAMICHEAWIRRWLHACAGDAKWAMTRILNHLQWRQEYKVDDILDEDWSQYDKRAEMYPSSICKAGRPTWTWNVAKHAYASNGVEPNGTPEMGARYLVLTLERVWAMNPSANRMNVICNCRDMGIYNYEHAMCQICLDILSEQYPDNMEVCFIFPVTWVVSAVVAVCRVCLMMPRASGRDTVYGV